MFQFYAPAAAAGKESKGKTAVVGLREFKSGVLVALGYQMQFVPGATIQEDFADLVPVDAPEEKEPETPQSE